MNIYMVALAAALRLGTTDKTDLQVGEQAVLSKLCNLHASNSPIELKDAPLTIRLSVYAPMELIGLPPCKQVKFFILDSELGRRFERLTKKNEDNKKYVAYYQVSVDGLATFDPELNAVRINLSNMSCWRETTVTGSR